MIACVGLIKYLGLNSSTSSQPPAGGSKIRTTRRSQALPGQSCYLLTDDGEEYKVTVVGSFAAWHKAFNVNRPSSKILQLSTQRGTTYSRDL